MEDPSIHSLIYPSSSTHPSSNPSFVPNRGLGFRSPPLVDLLPHDLSVKALSFPYCHLLSSEISSLSSSSSMKAILSPFQFLSITKKLFATKSQSPLILWLPHSSNYDATDRASFPSLSKSLFFLSLSILFAYAPKWHGMNLYRAELVIGHWPVQPLVLV